jgi:hypothetical protein
MQLSIDELNEIINNPEVPLTEGEENNLIRQSRVGNLESRKRLIQNRMEHILYLAIMTSAKHELTPANEPVNMEVLNTLITSGEVGVDMAIDEYKIGGNISFKSLCQGYIIMGMNLRVNEMV